MMSKTEARTLTDEIRADAEDLYRKILRAFEGEAHTALGYASWEDYRAAEFPVLRQVERAERHDLAVEMTAAGMFAHEVADALGVSERTVKGDLARAKLPEQDPQPESLSGTVWVPLPDNAQPPGVRTRDPEPLTDAEWTKKQIQKQIAKMVDDLDFMTSYAHRPDEGLDYRKILQGLKDKIDKIMDELK